MFFVDRATTDNNLAYCETITATNPCGEQPLTAYGCCCLGRIDLTRFVREPFSAAARFDFEAFGRVVRPAVRMLDNVLDATVWPLKEQQDEARAKRRVGLGFTGLGDALILLGKRYDTEEAPATAAAIMQRICETAYRKSIELAREKGSFPLLDRDKHQQGICIQAAARHHSRHRAAWHPQLAPDGDCAYRHHQPARQQRFQRPGAGVPVRIPAADIRNGRRAA